MICGVISPTWHRNCSQSAFIFLVCFLLISVMRLYPGQVRRMNPRPDPSFDCGGLLSHALGSSDRKMFPLGSCRE